MKKIIPIVLLSAMLLACFAGCSDNLSDKEKFIKQIKHDFSSCENDGTIEFRAELFAEHASISSAFPIDIKIVENGIYIHGVLYNSIKIVKSPTFSYDDALTGTASVTKDEVASMAQKIKKSKTCYVLETDVNGAPVGQTIAVYVIEGEYYFVDNIFCRIWRANK